MARKTLQERVLTLEQQMMEIRDLPAHVTEVRSEISQLRTETRGEFSALRGEMATLGDALRGEMATLGNTLRGEMAAGFAVVRGEMATFRAEMTARDEETSRHARMLHEDVIGRLALTREGKPRSPRTRKRR
jgi:hypothetical protein